MDEYTEKHTIERWTYKDNRGAMSFIVPEEVTGIGNYAFSSWYNLQRIELPRSLTFVGDNAFNGCRSLVKASLPPALSSLGERAFAGCESLEHMRLPDGLRSLASSLFEGCIGLMKVDLPAGLNSIGDWAFHGCKNLREIWIPDSVTRIGARAFDGCEKLEKIHIPKSMTYIGPGAFHGCFKLADRDGFVVVENHLFDYFGNQHMAVVPDGVKSIASYAFAWQNDLRNIQIPESVISIGDQPFWECRNLERIDSLNQLVFDSIPGTDQMMALAFLEKWEAGAEERRFLTNYILEKKDILLPIMFKEDQDNGLRFYDAKGIFTVLDADNLFKEAKEYNAIKCMAFLLEWNKKNSEQKDPMEEFEL